MGRPCLTGLSSEFSPAPVWRQHLGPHICGDVGGGLVSRQTEWHGGALAFFALRLEKLGCHSPEPPPSSSSCGCSAHRGHPPLPALCPQSESEVEVRIFCKWGKGDVLIYYTDRKQICSKFSACRWRWAEGPSLGSRLSSQRSWGLCVWREPARWPGTLRRCLVFPLHVSPAKSLIQCKSLLGTQISITHRTLRRRGKESRTEIVLRSSDLWCKRGKERGVKIVSLQIFCLACIFFI